MDQQAPLAGCCCAVVVLVLYLYMSISVLRPTEKGLDLSFIRYEIGEEFDAGRHWLGLGHRFIVFPTNLQTMEFVADRGSPYKRGGLLRSRTSDGLEVQLEVSLQYQLPAGKGKMKEVYAQFGEAYDEVYSRIAQNTINQNSTQYAAFTFFSKRSTVEAGLRDALTKAFRDEAKCDLRFFQLRSVSLPTSFEQAIQLTEVRKQDVEMAIAEVDWRTKEAETKVKEAVWLAEVVRLEAEATNATIFFETEAWVNAFDVTQGLASSAFSVIHQSLSRSEEDLLEYIKVRALRNHPSSKSIVSVKMN